MEKSAFTSFVPFTSLAMPSAPAYQDFPREVHFYTPRFSKDIEITAPATPHSPYATLHADISNWSSLDAVIHQGPTKGHPAIAGARFHSRHAELAVGDPNSPAAQWITMHNEHQWFGQSRFLIDLSRNGSTQTYQWERTREGDDGVPGKHHRLRDTNTGHVVALYVVGSRSRQGRLVYCDAMPTDQALFVLVSIIAVIVKGRRAQAGAAGAAGGAGA